jgi:hypothetical protein
VAGTGIQQTNIRNTSPLLTYDTGTGEFSAGGPYTANNQPFFRNVRIVTKSYTVTSVYNEMSVGPITINNNVTVPVTVTIQSGARWSIV